MTGPVAWLLLGVLFFLPAGHVWASCFSNPMEEGSMESTHTVPENGPGLTTAPADGHHLCFEAVSDPALLSKTAPETIKRSALPASRPPLLSLRSIDTTPPTWTALRAPPPERLLHIETIILLL